MFRLLTGQYAFGEGFEAVANVKMGARTPWPSFMTTNPQFSVYSKALQQLVESCLGETLTSDHSARVGNELRGLG